MSSTILSSQFRCGIRAGLIDLDSISSYPWSSLWHFPKRTTRPSYMDASWLDYLVDADDSKGGWVRYQNLLKLRAETDPLEIRQLEQQMNRGWCIGSKDFKKELAADYFEKKGLLRMEKAELKEFNEMQWEQFIQKALQQLKKLKQTSTKTRGRPDGNLPLPLS